MSGLQLFAIIALSLMIAYLIISKICDTIEEIKTSKYQPIQFNSEEEMTKFIEKLHNEFGNEKGK